MNNYLEETATKCEGTKQATNNVVSESLTIAAIEKDLHENLLAMVEILRSYIGRMYGKGEPDSEPTIDEPMCFIQTLGLDAQISDQVLKLLKFLCDGLGV